MEELNAQELRQKVLERHLHRAPSVGSVVNRILEVNPSLGAAAVTDIVRRSTSRRGKPAGDFALAETIDVARALELARATLAN